MTEFRERLIVTIADKLGIPALDAAAIPRETWLRIAEHARLLAIPDEPERVCSVCGVPESSTEFDHLTDIRVIAAAGEEGFADITQLLCDEHLTLIAYALVRLGFKDHRHGGANFLEDPDCPGASRFDDCPTPLYDDDLRGESYVAGQPEPADA